jgi:hypothetical protein
VRDADVAAEAAFKRDHLIAQYIAATVDDALHR